MVYFVDFAGVLASLSIFQLALKSSEEIHSQNKYLTWYPGDQYVDILGVDNYGDLKSGGDVQAAIRKLHIVVNTAKQKDKLSAFTETGLENVTDEKWFTEKLGKVLSDPLIKKEISYVMVWRNDERVHYFFPYPGQKGAADAAEFLDNENILLLEDFKALQ